MQLAESLWCRVLPLISTDMTVLFVLACTVTLHADVTIPHFGNSSILNVTFSLLQFLTLLQWRDILIIFLCCCVLSACQRFDWSGLAPPCFSFFSHSSTVELSRQGGTVAEFQCVSLSVWYLIRRLPHDPSRWFILSQEMHLLWAHSSARTDTENVMTSHPQTKKFVFSHLPATFSAEPGSYVEIT